MYRLVFILSFFCLLFMGENVLSFMGYGIGISESPFWQKLYPSIYFFLFLIIGLFFKRIRVLFNTIKRIKFYLLIFSLLIIFSIFSLKSVPISFLPNNFFLPILVLITLSCSTKEEIKIARKILILFFVLSSLLAIFEKILHIHIFSSGFLRNNISIGEFRSTSFNDHPLNNSLITSVIMGFLLVSEMKLFNKITLFMLGYVALLCFGSRSSSGLMILFLIVFIFKYQSLHKASGSFCIKKNTFVLYFLFFTATVIISVLLFNSSIADRILNNLTIDKSILARVDVFNILRYLSFKEFVFGVNTDLIISYMRVSGLGNHIENFWILWVLWFGIPFTILLSYYFISFCWKLISNYSSFSKKFVFAVFFVIASTNNSLAYSTTVISVFVLCAKVLQDGFLSRKELA
ncbi:VpsF family polysaccharide biosynthesis protein [Thermophagus xiamenensis]|uniref:O-Antigen ligase n=1 Tax=Thermophagus xiamenensis TaxID=385682 RepID=A0A1I2DPK4_9BACT|nr:VpsF family polysaccharide biosynthesis protein [Thermophagus xiamenensis]SFE81870.1 hypothetical protein SAMN05444380_11960 [Thermophagus xiamenensis]